MPLLMSQNVLTRLLVVHCIEFQRGGHSITFTHARVCVRVITSSLVLVTANSWWYVC